jgi:hypothetical protein
MQLQQHSRGHTLLGSTSTAQHTPQLQAPKCTQLLSCSRNTTTCPNPQQELGHTSTGTSTGTSPALPQIAIISVASHITHRTDHTGAAYAPSGMPGTYAACASAGAASCGNISSVLLPYWHSGHTYTHPVATLSKGRQTAMALPLTSTHRDTCMPPRFDYWQASCCQVPGPPPASRLRLLSRGHRVLCGCGAPRALHSY